MDACRSEMRLAALLGHLRGRRDALTEEEDVEEGLLSLFLRGCSARAHGGGGKKVAVCSICCLLVTL